MKFDKPELEIKKFMDIMLKNKPLSLVENPNEEAAQANWAWIRSKFANKRIPADQSLLLSNLCAFRTTSSD